MSTENLAGVKDRLRVAVEETGVGSVPELIAVSKSYQAAAIEPVLQSGHRLFGENRVQEAQGKWPALKEKYPDTKLHLIGPLQSNKSKDAVAMFDAIHTIDREKIARAIAKEQVAQDRALQLFVQVKTMLKFMKLLKILLKIFLIFHVLFMKNEKMFLHI